CNSLLASSDSLEQLNAVPLTQGHDRLFPRARHANGPAPRRAALLTGDVHDVDAPHAHLEELFHRPPHHDLVGSLADLEHVLTALVQHRILLADNRSEQNLMGHHQADSSGMPPSEREALPTRESVFLGRTGRSSWSVTTSTAAGV